MAEIVKQLHSPVFWICSVLAGLSINVLSHYVIAWGERIVVAFGLGSKRMFVRWNDRRQRKFNQRLSAFEVWVTAKPNGMQLALAWSFYKRMRYSAFFMIGGASLAFAFFQTTTALTFETLRAKSPNVVPLWLTASGSTLALVLSVLMFILGFAMYNDSQRFDALLRASKLFFSGGPESGIKW